jgi:hypothetical protein
MRMLKERRHNAPPLVHALLAMFILYSFITDTACNKSLYHKWRLQYSVIQPETAVISLFMEESASGDF